MIVVVDYGVNNLRSVVRALAAGGSPSTLTADPEVVRTAERLVVPGVGAFGQAMQNLTRTGLADAIRQVAGAGRPLLGICLGQQLFFERSEEAPGVAGLALLPGEVRRLPTTLPVPHVGWAEVTLTPGGLRHPALAPVFPDGKEFFYHVHSYCPAALAPDTVLGTADYGGPFATLVGRENLLGAQFHPEKSQRAGIALLAAFAGWRP